MALGGGEWWASCPWGNHCLYTPGGKLGEPHKQSSCTGQWRNLPVVPEIWLWVYSCPAPSKVAVPNKLLQLLWESYCLYMSSCILPWSKKSYFLAKACFVAALLYSTRVFRLRQQWLPFKCIGKNSLKWRGYVWFEVVDYCVLRHHAMYSDRQVPMFQSSLLLESLG